MFEPLLLVFSLAEGPVERSGLQEGQSSVMSQRAAGQGEPQLVGRIRVSAASLPGSFIIVTGT